MSNAQRIVLVVLAGVVIVGSLVLFTPKDEDDSSPATQASEPAPETGGRTATAKPRPPKPKATLIEIRGGEPDGPPRTIAVRKGETVRLVVSSDTPQEVHVHGYDLLKDAAAGKPARFRFKAGIEGVFEVELEGTHSLIAKLEVRPG
ncbi:MAG: hypothetical protein WD649_06400 [Thermoleophilaceae bacterium]